MTEPLENRIADEVVSLMRNQIPATEQGQYNWGAIWRGTQKIVQAQTGQPQAIRNHALEDAAKHLRDIAAKPCHSAKGGKLYYEQAAKSVESLISH